MTTGKMIWKVIVINTKTGAMTVRFGAVSAEQLVYLAVQDAENATAVEDLPDRWEIQLVMTGAMA